jgi:hypothetical protein
MGAAGKYVLQFMLQSETEMHALHVVIRLREDGSKEWAKGFGLRLLDS